MAEANRQNLCAMMGIGWLRLQFGVVAARV